jgi:HEAT repeat protein
MRYVSMFRTATGLLALLLCVSAASSADAKDGVSGDLDKLMARMPVETAAEKEEIVDAMLALGEAGVRDLCGRIKNQDEPLDGKVCSALFGLVHAAGRTGNEDVRKMVAGVFGEILQSDATIAAKSHLITELRTLGHAESVGPVSALLTNEDLYEQAAQTLVSIDTAEAAAALRMALPNLKGKARITVICALGRMRDRAAVSLLLKEAASADAAIRHAALFALAETGDPSAEAALRKAVAASDAGECEAAIHRLLRFALRLAENGAKQEAIAVYRSLPEQAGPDDSAIAPGAFHELLGLLEKDEALTEILAGLGHDNAKVRTVAIKAASDMPGEDVTKQLAEAMVRLPAAHGAPVAELLRQRGDPAALQPVVQALKAPDKNVRIAAMAAVGGLGKRDVAPQLMAFLDKTPEESAAARSALIAMGDTNLNQSLVEALSEVTPEAKCGLLAVLSGRDAVAHTEVFLSHTVDQDENVRHTALKILGAMDDAKIVTELMRLLAHTESAKERKVVESSLLDACRQLSKESHKETSEMLIGKYGDSDVVVECALIMAVKLMAKGHPKGLTHIKAALNDDAPVVRSAALRTLAEWPNPEPMEELLKIAEAAEETAEHVIALRGCIRMAAEYASSAKKEDKSKALEALQSAMTAARRIEEKRQVLGAVSSMGHAGALEIAADCLGDDALRAEAAAAAVKIGRAMFQPVRVLVAYDKSAANLPDWLGNWADTTMQLQTSDTGFKIYSQSLSLAKISLGGNKSSDKSSHYIVILSGSDSHDPAIAPALKKVLKVVKDKDQRKEIADLISQAEQSSGRADAGNEFHVAEVSTGSGCKVVENGLKKGAKVYVDRDYTFEKVPAELEGATYVMMANDDKKCADEEYISLQQGKGPEGDNQDTAGGSQKAEAVSPPVRVMLNGELVTEYHYADADRPYFYPVIAPTGDNITRHWPMSEINENDARDHKHQRSVWYTHGDVNGHDFWNEGKGPKIVQTKMEVDSGESRCVIIAENEWRAPDGEVVCTDVRRHTVRISGDNRTIDFQITIKASHGNVVFGDSKEGSMAMRVAPTLRTEGDVAQGSMVNSEGGSGKEIWGKRAKWCDYYGPINGKTVGIAIMDHPDNPRHPTTWHARDYGLCGANPFGLSYFEKKPKGAGDMEIKAGESVTFKYRVLVHNGTAAEADVEKLYQEYAAGSE